MSLPKDNYSLFDLLNNPPEKEFFKYLNYVAKWKSIVNDRSSKLLVLYKDKFIEFKKEVDKSIAINSM